jgi:hypothetical protein
MECKPIGRRTFLKSAGITVLAAAGAIDAPSSRAQNAVPNSAGTEPPNLKAPANAADCHIHIYDPRFQSTIPALPNATVQDYRLLQKRNGTSRVVIVTPRNYVTDNSVTVDAIARFAPHARGVAVLRPASRMRS